MELKDTSAEHKKVKRKARFGILTISSTRSLETDSAGKLIEEIIMNNNHSVHSRLVIKDNTKQISTAVKNLTINEDIDAIITTGGTGLADLDVTIEAVRPLFEKELIAFSSLFGQLSYEEIGSPAIMSRATAGIINKKIIFCIPGSPRACKLALEKLIIKEIGHILNHI